MNVGDQVQVPDGRIGTLTRLENNVATVTFNYAVGAYGGPYSAAFNASDVQTVPPAKK